MRAQQRKSLRFSLTIIMLLVAGSLAAVFPPRPVSLGVVANFEHNLARSANLGWSRMDISWAEIVPSPGAWNIQPTNNRVNFALQQGQQVLAILHITPPWLSSGGNVPPLSTTEWSAFVRRFAQEFRGRVAAYEIWNEPDMKAHSDPGIGWVRHIEEPPLYTDFVHAAAVEIRAQAPGTLVVAPAFLSRNDADGADNRKKRILQQIQAAVYPDGPGHSFVDVISVHNNAGSTESSGTMGIRLNNENLAYVWNHAPSLRTRPVWVTEFGWRSNAVGEPGQRQRTCEVVKNYTAFWNAFWTNLDDWNVTRGFIFTLKDPNISNTLFRGDGSAKPVVTQYLQFLPYPAVQQPADSPSCSGSGFAASVAMAAARPGDAGKALTDLGFRDPQQAIPAGFSELFVDRAPDGKSTEVRFGDSAEGAISIVVSQASPEDEGFGVLSDAGAQWTAGDVHVSVSGMRGAQPIGKGILRSIGAALDPSFAQACMIESVSADLNAVRRFGFSPAKAPAGFKVAAAQLGYTRPTKGCGAKASEHTPLLDFTWTFESSAGEVIRAGIYSYGNSFDTTLFGERSLHWSGKDGARYWVAADPSVAAPDQEALRAIAESIDSAFEQ